MTRDQIQAEGLKALGDRRRSGIVASMGTGKCLLGIKHMAEFYTDSARFLVVAPRKTIFQSWKDDAIEFGFEEILKHVEFSTYISLNKQDLHYDVIYLDECHSLKFKHAEWLDKYLARGGRIVGLTGTYPPRPSTEKGKMCFNYCPKVFEYKTDTAVEDKILNDYKIYVHKLYLNGNPDIEVERKDGGKFFTSEVKSYQYWEQRIINAATPKAEQIARIQRMKTLQKFKSKERYASKMLAVATKKTIVFANTQAQADSLCPHSVHSKNKDSDRNLEMFKSGEITQLSAVEQLSEGVTIPRLENGIILHAYGNNRRAAQKIGRLLRLNPDETATVHILCYYNSVDKDWVEKALKEFDRSKIFWIDPI